MLTIKIVKNTRHEIINNVYIIYIDEKEKKRRKLNYLNSKYYYQIWFIYAFKIISKLATSAMPYLKNPPDNFNSAFISFHYPKPFTASIFSLKIKIKIKF